MVTGASELTVKLFQSLSSHSCVHKCQLETTCQGPSAVSRVRDDFTYDIVAMSKFKRIQELLIPVMSALDDIGPIPPISRATLSYRGTVAKFMPSPFLTLRHILADLACITIS